MTALTENYARNLKSHKMPNYGVKAEAVIFRGALTMVDAAGYLVPCTQLAGAVFAGVSKDVADATGMADGEVRCDVEAVDAFEVDIAAAVQADIGKKVYALDDNTVELTQTTNSVEVGRIVEVISSTKVMVLPNQYLTK